MLLESYSYDMRGRVGGPLSVGGSLDTHDVINTGKSLF